VPKIKNEQEFDELMRETHDIVYELENGQPFKIVLVEDSHIPDSSIMMICIHHVFGDGIIWIGCVNAVADNGFVDLAKFARSAGFNPLLEAAGIVRGMKGFFDLLVSFDFGKKRAPEPKREYVMSRKFDMGKMKAACKGMKTPFQASFFAILSTALAEFFDRRNIKEDKVTIASAFSLKPIITKKEEIRSGNMICQIFTELTVTDDLMHALKKVPRPDVIQAYGNYYKAAILTSLPFDLGKLLLA
jgi:hypothetical protein